MQLHEVFAQSDDTAPPTKAVRFRALSPTKNGPPRDVDAVLAIVDEVETAASLRDAEAALVEAYRDKSGAPLPIPNDVRHRERNYQFLLRALRDSTDPRKPLARTALELRKALEPTSAIRLITAYNEWMDAEFPDTLSEEAFAAAEEDAAGK